jgi:hypothetical protein
LKRKKTKNDYFLFKVCLTSILQNSLIITLKKYDKRESTGLRTSFGGLRRKASCGQQRIPVGTFQFADEAAVFRIAQLGDWGLIYPGPLVEKEPPCGF